jgi:hypothetical protein
VDSQAPLAAVSAVLRSPDEHFYKVVVQGIIELALEGPFELGVIEIAGMKLEVVCVHGNTLVFELNDHFDGFGFGTSRER